MSKQGFVLDKKGVRELLTSPEMATVIGEYCDTVLQNAGGQSKGYTSNVQTSKRAVGRVYAFSGSAIKDNSENNTLLKALHD